jgi:hypothetical protein
MAVGLGERRQFQHLLDGFVDVEHSSQAVPRIAEPDRINSLSIRNQGLAARHLNIDFYTATEPLIVPSNRHVHVRWAEIESPFIALRKG